ncbi:MAG: hypothetical protein QM796_04600 [Chthoniobacteraceae bacterium]
MKLHELGVLEKYNVRMIGAKPEAIHKGEDRLAFKEAMIKIGLDMPKSGVAHTMEKARKIAAEIGTIRSSSARPSPSAAAAAALLTTRRNLR